MRLIILGSGKDLWLEFDLARDLMPDADLMCVNFSFFGLEWLIRTNQIFVRHWASLHSEFFRGFKNMYAQRTTTHCNHWDEGVDMVWDKIEVGAGTSGLFATKVALELGYKKIILCGMPLDKQGRFYDYRLCESGFDKAVLLSWENEFNKGTFGNKVKSFSGFTKRLLGEPDQIWLNT